MGDDLILQLLKDSLASNCMLPALFESVPKSTEDVQRVCCRRKWIRMVDRRGLGFVEVFPEQRVGGFQLKLMILRGNYLSHGINIITVLPPSYSWINKAILGPYFWPSYASAYASAYDHAYKIPYKAWDFL